MKKIIIFALLLLILTGCSSKKADISDTQPDSTKKESSETLKPSDDKKPENSASIRKFYVLYSGDKPTIFDETPPSRIFVSSNRITDDQICIDTKEKAIELFEQAKKLKVESVAFISKNSSVNVAYDIDEVIDGYKDGSWSFDDSPEQPDDTETQSDNSANNESAKPEESIKKQEYKPGTISGNKYESAYLGLGIELSGSWNFNSDSAPQSEGIITEFYANNATNESIEITLEKDTESTKSLSASDYTKAWYNQMKTSFEKDFDTCDIAIEPITYAQNNAEAVKISASKDGLNLYITLFIIDRPEYNATVLMRSTVDGNFEDELAMFYSVSE